MTKHIKLDENDFACLVRGGVLTIPELDAKIILADIGFMEMGRALDSAIEGIDTYKEHTHGEDS